MTDHAALLEEIDERNRLRRSAQLPLLDVAIEFEVETALRRWAAYHEHLGDLDDLKARLSEKAIARVRRRRGDPSWLPGNSIEQTVIGYQIMCVLKRILRIRTGLVEPSWPAKNIIEYGST